MQASYIRLLRYTVQFPRADPAAEYRHRSAQSISAFGIGPSVRIFHTTDEPCRRDIRTVEASRSCRSVQHPPEKCLGRLAEVIFARVSL